MWETKLTDGQKEILKNQSKSYILESNQQIEKFWMTRNFDKILHEAKSIDATKNKINLHESINNDPLANIMKMLQ